jgi:hypothetical protein
MDAVLDDAKRAQEFAVKELKQSFAKGGSDRAAATGATKEQKQ